jgi:hypothetical protein
LHANCIEQTIQADIDYLCNVLHALDVQPTDELLHANQLFSVEGGEFVGAVEELSPNPELVETIKKMRGLE